MAAYRWLDPFIVARIKFWNRRPRTDHATHA
jgi:hypothetical protein